jgi:hypothetical protein
MPQFCPTNQAIVGIAKAVGLKTTQALLDDLAKGASSLYLNWVTKVRWRKLIGQVALIAGRGQLSRMCPACILCTWCT